VNWKAYNKLSDEQKKDASKYILGIDIGHSTTSFAFFDHNSRTPQIIDISGGYSKTSVPTMLQYIKETKEWVIGEYAVLNQGMGGEYTIESPLGLMNANEYAEIDDKPINTSSLMGTFIESLIGNVRNIDPSSEIVGIIVSCPSYTSEDAKAKLYSAFKSAGYDKELIAIVSDRECILARAACESTNEPNGTVMLLDFAHREMRGAVLKIKDDTIKVVSAYNSEHFGCSHLDEAIKSLFRSYLEKPDKRTVQQLNAFAYQHKDTLFNKKQPKLYFNFVYPPFQKVVDDETVSELIERYDFSLFLGSLLSKDIYTGEAISHVDRIICVGGGFEYPWAKDRIRKTAQDMLGGADVTFLPNTKGATAEGACLLAAKELGVLNDLPQFTIEDKNQIKIDVGVLSQNSKFVPIIESHTFWWENHPTRMFVLGETYETPSIPVYIRDEDGEITYLNNIILDDFPNRPMKANRFNLGFRYIGYNEIEASITDAGFGEMFPKTDFSLTKRIII
jgi:molecular chaperone DnaK (HSP70)